MHSTAPGTAGFEHQATAHARAAQNPLGRQPARHSDGRIRPGSHKAHVKRQHKSKSRLAWLRSPKKVALALTAVLLIGGGYIGIKAYLQSRKILAGGGGAAALQENVDPSLLNGEGDGRVNILLLGKGGEGHTAPDLTDTILLASIDPVNNKAALVSLPRDTYVKTSNSGSMKINAVYSTAKTKARNANNGPDREKKAEAAGLDAIEGMVESILGVPVHYRAMVDFEGFKQAIDAVGGVEVDVKNPVYDVLHIDGKRYVLDVKEGRQKFDGFRALAFSRSRKTSSRGDFDRAERQRELLVGLRNKVFSVDTLGNPIKVNELLNALGNHVQTNFNLDEIMRLYEIGQKIDGGAVESIGLADPPNNFLITSNIGGQSVVVPKAGVNNYKEIQNFIRNRLRDSFLAQENANIMVLNGTAVSGLAGRTADELKSFGYTVSATADAPIKGYTQTQIVDMRGGAKKYTQHYLEQRFKTKATSKLPDGINPGNADFVIILGTNEQARLGN